VITLASLKQELEFNRSLGNIIEILKLTALAQFRSFQFKDKPNADYLKELENAFMILGKRAQDHPYFSDPAIRQSQGIERKSLPAAIVIVTSDEGFLGGLNTFLVNTGLEQSKSADDEVLVIGERGARYVEDAKVFFSYFPGISDDVKYGETERLSDYILDNYKKKFGRVVIIYPRFVSLTHQKIELFQLLPAPLKTGDGVSGRADSNPPYHEPELALEPTEERVIDILIALWLKFKLFEIFWSSKQSEAAARIMHLEGSTQELTGLNQKLAFDYFRRVHALSDKTIREICAAKVFLNKAAA